MKLKQSSEIKSMPFIFKIQLVVNALGVLTSLITINSPTMLFGGYTTGFLTIAINIFTALLFVVMIYGILNRFAWAWKLHIASFLLFVVLFICNSYMNTNPPIKPPQEQMAETLAVWTTLLFALLLTVGVYLRRNYLNKK